MGKQLVYPDVFLTNKYRTVVKDRQEGHNLRADGYKEAYGKKEVKTCRSLGPVHGCLFPLKVGMRGFSPWVVVD